MEDREHLDLEELFTARPGGKQPFVLKVRGDSMIEEQICDGDYVVVEPRHSVRNGQTVVALLDSGEATLKKYYRERDGGIRLQPANKAYEPIRVKDCKIQGVAIGVIRRMSGI